MIKLIAMDLDGTLLNNDHKTISKRNIDVLKTVAEKGIKIVIATGRTYCHIEYIKKQLYKLDYIIGANGAVSMDYNGHIITTDYMPYSDWSIVYNRFKEHNIICEVYYKGQSYISESDLSHYNSNILGSDFIEELKKSITKCTNPIYELKNKPAEKLTVLYAEPHISNKLKTNFEAMNLYVTSSLPYNMEITRVSANKGNGLKSLCNKIGIKQNEVLVFGDGDNDIDMLKWADCSYAMKNAGENVKSAAKFVADYNYNDGIAKVVEKLFKDIL